jgi:hypothetical protein
MNTDDYFQYGHRKENVVPQNTSWNTIREQEYNVAFWCPFSLLDTVNAEVKPTAPKCSIVKAEYHKGIPYQLS